jgi:hypothetical protein
MLGMSDLGKETQDVFVLAKDFTEVYDIMEAEDPRDIERCILTEGWLIADSREEYSGAFWIATIVYESAKTYDEDGVQYLVKADNIKEAEKIIEQALGEPLIRIKSIEICPFEVYNF